MSDRAALAIGLALWGLVLVLVLLPPVPDAYGGQAWLWLAGYAPVPLLLLAVGRRAAAIRRAWRSRRRGRRWLIGVSVVAAVLAGTLTLREVAPLAFGRLSRENGLWEPACLFLYWGGAVLLWRAVRSIGPEIRRPWLLVVGFFVLMGLEEIDWFGIFGGILGHVEGVYAGSLHDLIRLVKEKVVGPLGIAIAGLIGFGTLAFLHRKRILDPSHVRRLATGAEFVWFLAGLAILFVAAAEEAHLFGWFARDPTPEEAIELGGALCLGLWALELAAERVAAGVDA